MEADNEIIQKILEIIDDMTVEDSELGNWPVVVFWSQTKGFLLMKSYIETFSSSDKSFYNLFMSPEGIPPEPSFDKALNRGEDENCVLSITKSHNGIHSSWNIPLNQWYNDFIDAIENGKQRHPFV